MLKILTTVYILICSLVFSIHTSSMDNPYSYNNAEVNVHLAPLEKLEQLHYTFPDKTLDQLTQENGMKEYEFIKSTLPHNEFNDPSLPIPAFWFGCFLSWLGILVVYSVTKDSLSLKSALWGFVINFLFGCFIYTSFIINLR